MANFYIDYDEVDQEWLVVMSDAGQEHGQPYDIPLASCSLKAEALFIRDALCSFPFDFNCYYIG